MPPRVKGERKKRKVKGTTCNTAAAVLRTCKRGSTEMALCPAKGAKTKGSEKTKGISYEEFTKKIEAAEVNDRRRMENIFDKYTTKKDDLQQKYDLMMKKKGLRRLINKAVGKPSDPKTFSQVGRKGNVKVKKNGKRANTGRSGKRRK